MAFLPAGLRGDATALIEAALEQSPSLEGRLNGLIKAKLTHFAPNRSVLRGLLRKWRGP